MIIKDSRLKSMLERVALRVTNTHHPMIEDDILDTLEQNIDFAYPILDTFLENSSEKENYPTSEHQACLLLLCEILAYIHYSIEKERPWAFEFSEKLQQYIALKAFTPETESIKLQHLLEIFHQTEIEITDSIRAANSKLVEESEYLLDDEEEPDSIEALLEEIAGYGSGSEFELFENIISQTYQVVALDIQMVMIMEMLHSESEIIQNCGVLMLLHPEASIRKQVAITLTQMNRTVTPISLRRMILLRNWVPEGERKVIDQLVKWNRRQGVMCAGQPESEVVKILATGFDGVGAQSMLALVKQDKEYHLVGLLLKENIGIREPLIFKSHKKKDLDNIIKGMVVDSPCLQVSMDFLNQALPHFLTLNLKHNRPPSPLLLNFSELLGAKPWPAEAIAYPQVLKRLYGQLQGDSKFASLEKQALSRSKKWLERGTFADTWFEQDADVDNALMLIFKRHVIKGSAEITGLIDEVCSKILEPRRRKWYERLTWMALWAKANTKKRGPKWEEFLILAYKIYDGIPLIELPLMQSICEETIYIAARELMDESN